MKKTRIDKSVLYKIASIGQFIIENYKSAETAKNKIAEIRNFATSITPNMKTSRCCYNDYKWYDLGYFCIFNKGWVYAYTIEFGTVVIQGLEHSKNLKMIV